MTAAWSFSTAGHVSWAYWPSDGTGAPDSGARPAFELTQPQPPACGTVNASSTSARAGGAR